MRTFSILFLLWALSFAASVPDAYAEDDDALETTAEGNSIYVGVTIGSDWSGFPDKLSTRYEANTYPNRLNTTLPLYVTWILDLTDNVFNDVADRVDPPQPLSSYSWYSTSNAWEAFEVFPAVTLPSFEQGYVDCGRDVPSGMEHPVYQSHPLNAAGELLLEDVHGGFGGSTLIRLRKLATGNTAGVFIYLGWRRPQSLQDNYEGVVRICCLETHSIGTLIFLSPWEVRIICLRPA